MISWVSFRCFLSIGTAVGETFCWGPYKLLQLLKSLTGYSHCHVVFSLSDSAPGREGHFLYAGRAGLPQVQHWISFHEGTNQGIMTGVSV